MLKREKQFDEYVKGVDPLDLFASTQYMLHLCCIPVIYSAQIYIKLSLYIRS
jgi:hypothetical protein